MGKPSRKAVVRALTERHGTTYAEELGIDAARNTPAPLFQLLCASLLLSARISVHVAVDAARALSANGWTTPSKMAQSTWGERAHVLNMAGYARYDERTSTQLGETCKLLLDRYGGDLRKLRAEAGREPARERELLKQFPGIGDVGVDIFFREVQAGWQELVPFADRRALRAATRLGLPGDAVRLHALVDGGNWPRFVAALVRTELARDHDEVLEAAARPGRSSSPR